MAKKKNRMGQQERAYEAYLAQFPDWYWVRSLHDARILSTQTDIAFIPEADRPFHNCLALEIDSRGSYEEGIRTIYLCNYTWDNEYDINLLDMAWWLWDTLTGEDGNRHLNLTVSTADGIEKTVDIHFEFAIVIRD